MSGGEAHQQRATSSESLLMGEERERPFFQPSPALSGGGLEQELCLSGELTTSTAPDPSPETG